MVLSKNGGFLDIHFSSSNAKTTKVNVKNTALNFDINGRFLA
jgi:hypothetical protein